jgi:hypothetical protein
MFWFLLITKSDMITLACGVPAGVHGVKKCGQFLLPNYPNSGGADGETHDRSETCVHVFG